MTTEGALSLLMGLLSAAIHMAAPLLAVSLVAGVAVGLAQTVAQVNEASVSFVVKTVAVLAAIAVVGPSLLAYAVQYTRASLLAIEHVVH